MRSAVQRIKTEKPDDLFYGILKGFLCILRHIVIRQFDGKLNRADDKRRRKSLLILRRQTILFRKRRRIRDRWRIRNRRRKRLRRRLRDRRRQGDRRRISHGRGRNDYGINGCLTAKIKKNRCSRQNESCQYRPPSFFDPFLPLLKKRDLFPFPNLPDSHQKGNHRGGGGKNNSRPHARGEIHVQ